MEVYKKLIFGLNFLFIIINLIFLFLYSYNFIIENNLIFKTTDTFNIDLSKNNYSDISFYLNNKYDINYKEKYKNFSTSKKLIKILDIGAFNRIWNREWLKNNLDDGFIIEFNESEPDYLIYNVYNHFNDGNKDIIPKYQKCIKIAFYTENIMPDINYADYIIGMHHINYLDRYFKHSIGLFNQNSSSIDKIREEVLSKQIRTKFCAAVISNCNELYKFRLNFIYKLNQYKKVDMGGKCMNNVGGRVSDKKKFLSKYKFSIAMENSDGDGYLSEKIIDSFLSGTIPIYYGDYMIDEFINPKTYILIKDDKDMDKKIEYIKKIDNDMNLYKSIMKEKPILNEKITYRFYKNEIISFIKNIFSQDKKLAFRRDNNYYDYNCK